MANEVEVRKTMSAILASNGIKELTNTLSLSQEQITKAKCTALELSNDEKLKRCDPFSLVRFCFETARYNFSRNDCIYPVPYGDKVQTQLGYKGLRELALKAGYKEISCSEVYEGDKIYRDRETGKIKVEFNEDVSNISAEKLIGFYAYAIDSDGTLSNTLYWSKEKCQEHGKKYSKSFSSIWGTTLGFEKMAKKTVIKQLCGELRSTPLLAMAIKQDQIVHGGEIEEDEYLDNPLNDTSKEITTDTVANAEDTLF